MHGLIASLAEAARRRARYNRTVADLNAMSLDTALDLGIYHGDIHRIARRAVTGR